MMETQTLKLLKVLEECSVYQNAVKASAGSLSTEESTADRKQCVDTLKELEKIDMTLEILSKTQAGKKLRLLAKQQADGDIALIAKKLISKWKSMVIQGQNPSATDSQGLASPIISSQETSHKPKHAPNVCENANFVAPELERTGDSIRDKVRKNLLDALLLSRTKESVEVEDDNKEVTLACDIELAMHASLDGVSAKYKSKYMQLSFNLKDPKNPDLRRKVVLGDITPDELISASPEELASDAKKEENQRIREKKLFDSAPSSVKRATTDQFQCGKCRQRKCTYYQMQTRSADEPMTTFVQCTNCNNAWKFC